jgi:hypothetical protein
MRFSKESLKRAPQNQSSYADWQAFEVRDRKPFPTTTRTLPLTVVVIHINHWNADSLGLVFSGAMDFLRSTDLRNRASLFGNSRSLITSTSNSTAWSDRANLVPVRSREFRCAHALC